MTGSSLHLRWVNPEAGIDQISYQPDPHPDPHQYLPIYDISKWVKGLVLSNQGLIVSMTSVNNGISWNSSSQVPVSMVCLTPESKTSYSLQWTFASKTEWTKATVWCAAMPSFTEMLEMQETSGFSIVSFVFG